MISVKTLFLLVVAGLAVVMLLQFFSRRSVRDAQEDSTESGAEPSTRKPRF